MEMDRPAKRMRVACDRCHFQKLRCPKLPGQASCGRCERLGTACNFSPANRIIRQVPSAANGGISADSAGLSESNGLGWTPNTGHEDSTASFDWSPVVADLTFPPLIELNQGFPSSYDVPDITNGYELSSSGSESSQQPETASTSLNASPPTRSEPINRLDERAGDPNFNLDKWKPPFDNGLLKSKLFSQAENGGSEGDSPVQIVLWLSELSLHLAQHEATIPKECSRNPRQPGGSDLESDNPKAPYSADDLMNLTQYQVDIYSLFFKAFFPLQAIRAFAERGSDSTMQVNQNLSPMEVADLSSILLLISCHQRLNSMWSRVGASMQANVQAKAAFDKSGRLIPMQLYKCSSGHTVPMTMVRMAVQLTCQQLEQLVEKSSKLLKKLEQAQADSQESITASIDTTGNGSVGLFDVAISAAANLHQSAAALEKELSGLQKLILE